jgi:cold shock protein
METDLTGTVLEWSNEEGYGFIEGDNGTIYFVHFSGIHMEGYKTLEGVRRVVFNVDPDSLGDAHPSTGAKYAQVAVRVEPTDV